MRLPVRVMFGSVALLASLQANPTFASMRPLAANTCGWDTPPSGGSMVFQADIGSVYVPRDAPVGSVIGVASKWIRTINNDGAQLYCDNDGGARLIFNAVATAPILPGFMSTGGQGNGIAAVMQTNIPGVGIEVRLGFPLDDSATNAFVPDAGSSVVPYSAHHERNMGAVQLKLSQLEAYVTLVKTGPIAPGPQTLNGQELFIGNFTNVGKGFSWGLTGTVIQAQCSVSANPVSADPVKLGDWTVADFTGPGYATTAVPFRITLSSCDTDPTGGNVATANIRLDGIKGSIPVGDPANGIFGLTTDSTAQGIGIQILAADGSTPIALTTDVPLILIAKGDTVLDFTARFYQTLPSADIRPGLAKGALNFTMTYR